MSILDFLNKHITDLLAGDILIFRGRAYFANYIGYVDGSWDVNNAVYFMTESAYKNGVINGSRFASITEDNHIVRIDSLDF